MYGDWMLHRNATGHVTASQLLQLVDSFCICVFLQKPVTLNKSIFIFLKVISHHVQKRLLGTTFESQTFFLEGF